MGGRVLVIDDSFVVLAYVEEVLRKNGHTVVVAEDWAEARNVFRHHEAFDVVLVDVNLPGMRSGDSLAKSLRIHPKAQHAKIVYFSAESEENLEQLNSLSNMDGYIVKGQGDEQFLAAVEAFMSPSSSTEDTASLEIESSEKNVSEADKPGENKTSWWKE